MKLQARHIGTSQTKVNRATLLYPSVTVCLRIGPLTQDHLTTINYGVEPLTKRVIFFGYHYYFNHTRNLFNSLKHTIWIYIQ